MAYQQDLSFGEGAMFEFTQSDYDIDSAEFQESVKEEEVDCAG